MHVAREHVARRPPHVEHVARSTQHVARGAALFGAGGREAEIEEVFRRILCAGAPLDHVEIACASREDATLIWEKACRHEWPVTIAPGIPATVTRPGRALLAWCDWIDGRFAAVDFRHMLQSGDVGVDVEGGPTPGRAARLLALSEATWGRETYDIALTRLTRKDQGTADDEERSAESRELARENAVACEALKTWIRGLLDAVPQPDADGEVSMREFVVAAEAFVDACCATTSALDGAAKRALAEAVEELHALDRFQCTVAQAIAFVRERASSVSIASSRARPGHLHISSLPQAGYAGRPHLFVIGLEEGRVFPRRRGVRRAARRQADHGQRGGCGGGAGAAARRDEGPEIGDPRCRSCHIAGSRLTMSSSMVRWRSSWCCWPTC
jgi:hypothetical protein